MTGVRRLSAVLGCSLLLSLTGLMLTGVRAAYVAVPAVLVLAAVQLVRRKNSGLWLLTVAVSLTAASLLLAGFDTLRYDPSLRYMGEDISLTGTVADFPKNHPASRSVVLRRCVIGGEPTDYSVLIYFSDGSAPEPGDTVAATASEVFSSAQPDSRFFYHTLSGGVWLSAFTSGPLTVEPPEKRPILYYVKLLRRRLKEKAEANMPPELAAVSAAIVTGDRSEIPDGITDNFRKSGVSHLFAVSGMHLSLWTGLLFAVMRKRSRIRVLPNLLALAFIWFYAAFTAFSPSVIRAGIMLSLICAGGMIRKHADPLNSLGVAALGMLAANPWLAGNVSFLLSFAATYAIVRIFPLLFERQSAESVVKEKLLSQKEMLLLGVTVLFATLPFAAYFFGYLPALAPVTSLLCAPLAELLMVFSVLGALLPGGFFLTKGVYTVTASLANAIVKLTGVAGSLDFAIFPLRERYVAVWFVISAAALIILKGYKKASRAAVLNTMLALWAAALLTGVIVAGVTANDYTVFLPEAGNATFVSVVSGTGARSLVFGCGGGYDALSDAKDFMQARTAFSPDWLIVPRDKKAENENLASLLERTPPERMVLPEGAHPVRGLPEETYYYNQFDGEPLKNVTLRYETEDDFCGARMEINGTSLVFCLYPGSDFNGRDAAYLSGDYLICRGVIPATLDAGRFGTVIVLSDKPASVLGLPENAISTADTGNITLTIKNRQGGR